jgi:multiple sugar transport system substrate-binding protein
MKKAMGLLTSAVLVAALAGCGNSGASEEKSEAVGKTGLKITTDPVNLTIYQFAVISDDEIRKFIIEPVQKIHPNISFTIVRKGKGTQPEELAAAGIVPDLIYTLNDVAGFRDMGYAEDLNPFIKQTNFDLSRLDPNILDSIRTYGGGAELYAMPMLQNVAAMFYNKDIFDKFGVQYPKDGMTWDDAIQLATRVTRTDGGVRYIGMATDSVSRYGQGLSLPYVDTSTNKALIDTDGWKKVLSTVKRMIDIPGFLGEDKKTSFNINNDFFKGGTVAMMPNWVPDTVAYLDETIANNIRWDIVSLPNFPEALGTGRVISPHTLMMTKQSKYKNEVFEVMRIVTSNEVQTILSQNGKIPVVNNVDVQKQYGANLPFMKGKNVEGIFKSKPRPLHKPLSEYDGVVRGVIDGTMKELVNGKDINTILREAQDTADKKIAEELAKK